MFDFNEANELLKDEGNTLPALANRSAGEYTSDQAVKDLKDSIDIQPLIEKAQGYEIANVEQATQALSMALQARKLATALLNSKKEILRPQMDLQQAVNKLVADYRDKLEAIENNLKDKIEHWIDNSTDEAFTSGLDSIQVTDGSLKRVNTWCFEIEDTASIPFEYICADQEAIDKAIKSGVRTIPGVKVFLKQEIKLRVKN
jgi:predicted phage tail protein